MRSLGLCLVASAALLVLFCCSGLATLAHAESTQGRLHAGGPDAPYRRPVEERVMNLPEDGGDWHLVVVADGAQMTQFDTAIQNSPRLTSLVKQAKHHRFASGYWWSEQYLGGATKPVVMLLDERGGVLYKASGTNMPADAEELADEIESSIAKRKSDCGPDGCKPSPERHRPNIPDMRKDTPSDNPFGVGIPLVAVLLIVGCAFLALARKN